MKVCHLTSVHPAHDTRILLRECVSLRNAGHDVTLVAPTEQDSEYNGVKIVAVKKQKGRLKRMLITTRDVYNKAMSVNADVYHFHDPELILTAWWLRKKGKKVIYDVHEDVPQQILLKKWLPLRSIASGLYRLAEKIFLNGINIIAASENIRQRYYTNKNSITIGNFPDLAFLQPHINLSRSLNPYRIGYIGSVTFDRGLDAMLKAFEIVVQKYPSCWFDCIGPIDPETLKLVEKSDQYSLQNVTFHGSLSLRDCYALAKNARVGLCVLKPVPTYREAYPTKNFEYMSVGLPVVASDFDVVKEVVEVNDSGMCVDPLDSVQIANAIIYLFEHPKEADEMGKNGIAAAAEKYSWEAESKKLIEFYNHLE